MRPNPDDEAATSRHEGEAIPPSHHAAPSGRGAVGQAFGRLLHDTDPMADTVDLDAEDRTVPPGLDTSLSLPKLPPGSRECPRCEEVNLPGAPLCKSCGLFLSDRLAESWILEDLPQDSPARIAGKQVLHDKYRLLASLGESGRVRMYAAAYVDQGIQRLAVIRATEWHPVSLTDTAELKTPPPPPALGKTVHSLSDTLEVEVVRPGDPLQVEQLVLRMGGSSLWPQVLDSFESDGHKFLVLTPALGLPILNAWKDPAIADAAKLNWLEQVRRALVALHQQQVIFPGLEPRKLLVGADGVVRCHDLSGLIRLPVVRLTDVCFSLAAAPELFTEPTTCDLRADAYTFGALLYALHVGRELLEDDFEYRGMPRPLTDLLADALPPLVRLLSKTFVHNVALRFPGPRFRRRDPSGFEEIGEALADYGQVFGSISYDLTGWSTTGTIRGANEDCFAISHLSAGGREYRRELAFVCVADGMGGHAGGEVASALAISTAASYLRANGLSSASLQPFGKEHPFDSGEQCQQLLRSAVLEANAKVREAAEADPDRPAMGCTLEALLLVGRRAFICHVGDSRVYYHNGLTLRRITRDQTMVNRLVDLGRLSVSEAAAHPRRFELAQAIGSQREIMPDEHVLELSEGDWILACSDGLTAHVTEDQISEVLMTTNSAELATRRLVNLALTQGGSDNCTLVTAYIR